MADKQTAILVACTHDDIRATILRLINNNNAWHATAAENAGQTKALLAASAYDLLLLGNGLTEQEEQELTVLAKAKNSSVITHFGGGSGLLFGEIYEALGK